jgi:hypothetical protein
MCCHSNDIEAYVAESQHRLAPSKNVRPYLKNNKAKRAEGVARVVEHLPSKRQALNSNPSTTLPISKYSLSTCAQCYHIENQISRMQASSMANIHMGFVHCYSPRN